jgi:hypothetical protein
MTRRRGEDVMASWASIPEGDVAWLAVERECSGEVIDRVSLMMLLARSFRRETRDSERARSVRAWGQS